MKSRTLTTILPATFIFALGTYAYAADESAKVEGNIDYKKNGGYESTLSSKDTTANGTDKSAKTDVNVDMDSKGGFKKEIKSESVEDPKGLMNKKTTSSDTKINAKPDGSYKKTVKASSTDRTGTDYSEKTKEDVKVDSKGNVTTSEEMETTTNPKGLLNKKTTTTVKKKIVNGEVTQYNKDSN